MGRKIEKSSHKNKKALSPFNQQKKLKQKKLLETECKTPYGCPTLSFYQKYFL